MSGMLSVQLKYAKYLMLGDQILKPSKYITKKA